MFLIKNLNFCNFVAMNLTLFVITNAILSHNVLLLKGYSSQAATLLGYRSDLRGIDKEN